jgi:hypothetical protein
VDEHGVMVWHGITWANMEVKGIGMEKTPRVPKRSRKINRLVFYLKAAPKEIDSF